MGLDMYMTARRYINKVDWKATNEAPNREYVFNPDYLVAIAQAPEGIDELASVQGIHVEYPIGYWRKANAIHNWLVNNCAPDGEDNCRPFDVPQEKLMELRALVEEVLDNPDKAKELLPTGAGFFFGSTEYDEWYIKDLEHTKAILDKALALPEMEYDISYQASW